MKTKVTYYQKESFKDFKDQNRVVTVCVTVLEATNKDCVEVYPSSNCEGLDIIHEIYIGYAICCPTDSYDENVGKKISYQRAISSDPVIVTTRFGIINEGFLFNLLEDELDYIISNPGKFIRGYNEAEKRYLENVELDKEVKNLTNTEAEIIQHILDGVNFYKCLNIAEKLNKRNASLH